MDISKGGAKVATTTAAPLPDRFELSFSQGEQNRSCDVIWRHGRICGVKFAS
jgi:PilZ domain